MVYTVDMVYIVDMVYTVDMVNTVDMSLQILCHGWDGMDHTPQTVTTTRSPGC